MGLLKTLGKLLSGETISFEKTTHINLAKNLLTEDKQNYIGTWHSASTNLFIKPDGNIEYRREERNGNTTNTNTVSGPINAFDGASFIVGVLGRNTRFEVSAPPQQNGNGKMIINVNGEWLEKA